MRGGLATILLLFTAAAAFAATPTPAPSPLQQRIDAAEAGATLVVGEGTHAGPLVIRKPLHLIGERGAVIDGQGRGHVIEVFAPDVAIEGLVIRHSGSNLSNDDAGIYVRAGPVLIRGNTIVDTLHGIYLRQAPNARVLDNIIRGRSAAVEIADPLQRGVKLSSSELCSVEVGQDQRGNGIHIWNCSGHTLRGNDIQGTRDGIYFSFCNRTVVENNLISDVRYGLHYMYSDDNVFTGNRFTRNAAGSALMYSKGITLRDNQFVSNRSHRAYGLLMHSVENTVIKENRFQGNTIGVYLENCVANSFRGNTIHANYIGLRVADSSTDNRFTANRLAANVHSVETSGFETTNTWSVDGVGNDWDGAMKLDLNRDGIADVPHLESDLFGAWRKDFPEIGLLSGSAGERALRFLHSRIRLPGMPGVRDDHPLAGRSR